MKPIGRILAATDLSAPARHAVERGFRIAAASGAPFGLVHALELDSVDTLREWLGGEGTDDLKRQIEAQAREALADLLSDSAKTHGVAATAAIACGAPVAAIVAHANEQDADLLVLGARGGDYLRHMLLGSTASRVLRKAARPVLIVKQPPHEPYRRLLIPVDFSAASAPAIRLGRRIAPDADIVLLHAFEAPFEGKLAYAGVDDDVMRRYRIAARDEALRRMRELAAATGLAVEDYMPVVVHGDASQQTIAHEQELDCDLIVMGKHGTHVVEELLLGSTTKHVLAESQGDVLVVCEPRAA